MSEKFAFPFLTTRLLPPPTRPDLIPRARLYDKLARGLSYPLLLVVAPAGFGKTTLVSGWLRTLSQPVAWVTLDPADNDPARFWGYFTAAVEKAYPVILNLVAIPYQFFLDGTAMAPEANLATLINPVWLDPVI